VWLEATIDAAGTVTELEVLRGVAGLNVATVDAICCWRYRPAMKNGRPVAVTYPVYMDYGLR
jgi:outer membrane biosynthesis protein TonB